MPENFLITGGIMGARPRVCASHAAIVAVAWLASAMVACADDAVDIGSVVRDASANLSAHEVAALALVASVFCFAVVTAILLVRTRRQLADMHVAARDAIAAAKAESDHANVLLRAEPHIRIAWAT